MSEVNKILVPFDGSKPAKAAVRYIGGLFPAEYNHIRLMYVLPQLPEAFLDLNIDESDRENAELLEDWRIEQRQLARRSLEAAKESLITAGFPENRVRVDMPDKNVGVARDILAESSRGYRAVVVGRRGRSAAAGVSMGSVAIKLLASMHHLPLIIVGGDPETEKILLAYDGSSGAKHCLACLGVLLSNADKEVMLCHVIRPLGIHQTGTDFFKPSYERDWVESSRRRMIPALAEAKEALVKAGVPARRIAVEILAENVSRAGALVREAGARGIGTIVVGRRGLTLVDEFLIGRVATKVVQMAKDHAVWVVN